MQKFRRIFETACDMFMWLNHTDMWLHPTDMWLHHTDMWLHHTDMWLHHTDMWLRNTEKRYVVISGNSNLKLLIPESISLMPLDVCLSKGAELSNYTKLAMEIEAETNVTSTLMWLKLS